MPIEYIAMQDSNGQVHVNTVDTTDKIALAHNVQQYKTLTHVAAAFPGNAGANFLHEQEEPAGWDEDAHYDANDLVAHDGKTWVALADVERGSQPDDVYAPDGATGGWMPL
jgi:hypothetical protein